MTDFSRVSIDCHGPLLRRRAATGGHMAPATG